MHTYIIVPMDEYITRIGPDCFGFIYIYNHVQTIIKIFHFSYYYRRMCERRGVRSVSCRILLQRKKTRRKENLNKGSLSRTHTSSKQTKQVVVVVQQQQQQKEDLICQQTVKENIHTCECLLNSFHSFS